LHFEVSGTGTTPLLCIHGWGCEGGQFAGLAAALDARFRIYRPDLPGHGKSQLGSFQPSFENYAGAIVEFANEHCLANPVLLGHSMGGVLALMAAASAGLQPRAIINLDGGLPPAARTLAGQAAIRSWLGAPDFREKLADALRESFFLPQERDARCEAIIRKMCSAPDAVLRFLPEQVAGLDASAFLTKLSSPVLYVGTSAPRFDAEGAAGLVANLQVRQIAGAGHFIHIYALPRAVALMKEFLH
jgi:pimeloyl-ACP methyl ester carboxylesterase